MATLNQTSARPFKCPSCAKAFTRHENLKRHVNTHHSGFNARSFQCTLCNARFARSDLRKRHVENCHVQSFSVPKTVVSEPQLPLPAVAQSPSSAWLEILMADPTPFPPPPAPPVSKISVPFQPQVLNVSNESPCITAFFSHFHRNFPILHEASFHVISAPTPLFNAITCIGSMYCTSEYTEQSRNNLFESTLASVQSYVEQNRSRYQETWVLQTFLLLEYMGIYGGNDTSFLKAQRIHRDLVDAIRMLQMSHDGGASLQDSSDMEDSEHEEDEQFEGMESLDSRWQEFVRNESKKRCIYTLYLLDSQLSILCNLRPMLSSLEIKYGLPSCEDIWLAKTSTEWSALQKQQFRSFDDHDDQSYTQETPPSQGFFYEASQSLLHSSNSSHHHEGNGNGNETKYPRQPRKLRLLWASPFAAVILVIQLQMMARELTHASCLLERPKSQRRTLSVLTDKQHAQISQALKGIAELVPRNQSFAATSFSSISSSSSSSSPPSFNFFDNSSRNDVFGYGYNTQQRSPENEESDSEETPLWHTFWILWYYTSITLSHPDSLLVSGIVEVNLPLAIATAGHLATPRSKDKRDFYEDRDVFRILSPLESALSLLSPQPTPTPTPQPQTQPPTTTTTTTQSSPHIHETPFTTLLGFKICLVGWRLVRLTMGEAAEAQLQTQQAAAAAGNSRPKRKSTSNPCKFVLDAIMACVYDSNCDDGDDHGGGMRPGREIMRSEVCFLEWIVESFKKRSSWPVGKWVTAVMEERLATAAEAHAASSKTP